MKAEDYFGDWYRFIDTKELFTIIGKLKKMNPNLLCPSINNVFRAFELCSYSACKIICISQDPYPQKGVSTGILFGNSKETPEDSLSPSLQVIKESVINFRIPHNFITFDNSLEDWARQGILMLNSALTCEVNKIGSHVMLWRNFTAKFLRNMSNNSNGIIYALFGKQAQTFKPYINSAYNDILECEHPAYFARMNKPMPRDIFDKIDELIKLKYNEKINWFYEQN